MRPCPGHACVKVGDLVTTRPELLRALDDEGHTSDLGMVINLIPDRDGGEPWPLIRWSSGEIVIPIASDLVVISES